MTSKRISHLKNSSNEIVSEKAQKAATPRHEYLEEKERIKNEIGNLEQIRLTLGLSQRRACQLLLVDPSAWTRWNKTEAPPHIYQALKWLLELRKVNPEAAGPRNIESRIDFVQSSTQSKIERLEAQIEMMEKALAYNSTMQAISQPTGLDHSPSLEALEAKLNDLEAKIEAAQTRLTPMRLTKKRSQKSKNTKRKAKKSKSGSKKNKKTGSNLKKNKINKKKSGLKSKGSKAKLKKGSWKRGSGKRNLKIRKLARRL